MEAVPPVELNLNKTMYVETDASQYAIGAVLQQRACECDQHDICKHPFRPVALMSRKLTTAQRNWPPREQECYAIVAALSKWAHWIAHAEVVVLTDHQSLQHLEGWHTELFSAVDCSTGRKPR